MLQVGSSTPNGPQITNGNVLVALYVHAADQIAFECIDVPNNDSTFADFAACDATVRNCCTEK